jgi:hypothetical protein
LTKKINIQYGFLKFPFFFSWFTGYQIEKIGIVKCTITSSDQTKKITTLISVKLKNKEKGKR